MHSHVGTCLWHVSNAIHPQIHTNGIYNHDALQPQRAKGSSLREEVNFIRSIEERKINLALLLPRCRCQDILWGRVMNMNKKSPASARAETGDYVCAS